MLLNGGVSTSAFLETQARPEAHGRAIVMGGSKLHVRGVTYGSFRETDGIPFPAPERVRADFDAIAAAGLNAVRTYHVPPEWLMDLAIEQGLRIMVGLPWEQHVAFLDDRGRAKAIEARVREEVRMCAGHRAVLCYVVGSEIPATIVRWHGRRKIERFIERLYLAAKEEDERALATYVNYPSTEYLDLPFLDFATFNVYWADSLMSSRSMSSSSGSRSSRHIWRASKTLRAIARSSSPKPGSTAAATVASVRPK